MQQQQEDRSEKKEKGQDHIQPTKSSPQNPAPQMPVQLQWVGNKLKSKLSSSNTKEENDRIQDSRCPHDKNKPGEAQLFLGKRPGIFLPRTAGNGEQGICSTSWRCSRHPGQGWRSTPQMFRQLSEAMRVNASQMVLWKNFPSWGWDQRDPKVRTQRKPSCPCPRRKASSDTALRKLCGGCSLSYRLQSNFYFIFLTFYCENFETLKNRR